MLSSGLAALMIIINGMVLTHTSPAKEVGQKGSSPTLSSHLAVRHISDRNHYYMNLVDNGKMRRDNGSKRIKNWQRLVRELESVIIKLRNVIDKYDLKEKELKVLYSGVSVCGRENCGKFPHFLLENRKLGQFRCKKFKNPKGLKKWTSKLLLFFQKGVQNFTDSFKKLMNFELSFYKKGDLSNGSRLRIIKELYTDVNTLNLEIREIEIVNVMTNARLNSKPNTMALLGSPESQTDLMLYEWRIIQQSKEFLEKWLKQIIRVFKCWKKMSRKGFKAYSKDF